MREVLFDDDNGDANDGKDIDKHIYKQDEKDVDKDDDDSDASLRRKQAPEERRKGKEKRRRAGEIRKGKSNSNCAADGILFCFYVQRNAAASADEARRKNVLLEPTMFGKIEVSAHTLPRAVLREVEFVFPEKVKEITRDSDGVHCNRDGAACQT